MTDKSSSKNSTTLKKPLAEVAIMVFIAIAIFSLLGIVPRYKYPLNIVLITVITILLVIQFIFIAKSYRKQEIIEKNSTYLEWVEPRKAWHITEARWFSFKMLAFWFIIIFVVFFLSFAIVIKIDPPLHPNRNTLTFAMLPAFSTAFSVFAVALYASLWWWAKIKIKLTNTGLKRVFHNSTTTWKYDRIKNYSFEPLCSKDDLYTLVIFQNHKGKKLKIALDDTVDKEKIEEVLKEHGIPKLEQQT